MRPGLIARLRERGVLRVAASYAVIAWLALQIADVVLEPWNLPAWVHRAPLVVALLGFPIAIALAWFLELGDGAITRDVAAEGAARPVVHGWRRHVDIAVISVLGAIVGFFVMRDAGWLGESARPGRGVESSSLAVLPFANTGAYGDQHVSDGLSDELRNQFSRMQSLRVTARSSSIAFQDQSLDAIAIAGKLAVAALLEGTVGRGGGRLQVSVQLIDGRDGKVMWAERYDRPDKDLLAVQREIANAVVAAVLPRFAASGQAAPAPPTEDPVAYDLYLLARQKLLEVDTLGLSGEEAEADTVNAQAIDLLRSAIAADAKFAQAHATLAGARLHQALNRIDEGSNEAQAAAIDREVMPDIEQALALDPRNAEAYFVKGRLLRNTHRGGAGAAFQRAVELDPSHAPATISLGFVAVAAGRVDERHRLVMRARDLDPMDPQTHLAALMSAWVLGRVEEQRAIVARMTRLFPDSDGVAVEACWSWSMQGRPDETLACIEAAGARLEANPALAAETNGARAYAYLAMGDEARAWHARERAEADQPAFIAEDLRRRGDLAGLRELAERTLARRLTVFDAAIADPIARAGLKHEAVRIYRQAGIPEILVSDQWFKVLVLPGILQLVALLESQGEHAAAVRLLEQATEFTETLRRHGGRNVHILLALGKCYALAGRTDEAIELLALAIDAHDSPFPADGLEHDLALARLSGDPRFKAQLQRLRERQAQVRARLPETFRRHDLAWPPE